MKAQKALAYCVICLDQRRGAGLTILRMHGKGTFFELRLKDEEQFPVAARAGFDNVRNDTDLVSAKLPALHVYQLSISAPTVPEGGFNVSAAAKGKQILLHHLTLTCNASKSNPADKM